MKKICVSVLMCGVLAILATAESVVAQTTVTAKTPADMVSEASNIIASVTKIEAQRESISAIATVQLAAAAKETSALAGMPLATTDERAAVSAQIKTITSQINGLAPIVSGLVDLRTGEVILLGTAKNDLVAANNMLSS